jgi:hypothetical protein
VPRNHSGTERGRRAVHAFLVSGLVAASLVPTAAVRSDAAVADTGPSGTTGVTGPTYDPPQCPAGAPGISSYWCPQWDDDGGVATCQGAELRGYKDAYGRREYFVATESAVGHPGSENVNVRLKLRREVAFAGDSPFECAGLTQTSVVVQLGERKRPGRISLKTVSPIGARITLTGNNDLEYDGHPNELVSTGGALTLPTALTAAALHSRKYYLITKIVSAPLVQVPAPPAEPGPMRTRYKRLFTALTASGSAAHRA